MCNKPLFFRLHVLINSVLVPSKKFRLFLMQFKSVWTSTGHEYSIQLYLKELEETCMINIKIQNSDRYLLLDLFTHLISSRFETKYHYN